MGRASRRAVSLHSSRCARPRYFDANELPDLSDVYPDDRHSLAEIGFQTEPGATPAQTLVQACGQSHNHVLDQSLSRARFNIDFSRMDRAALDRAIARISLPLDSPGHMPPPEFRQVDRDALEPLVRFLEGDVRSAADDELLGRAAQLGMAVEVDHANGPYVRP